MQTRTYQEWLKDFVQGVIDTYPEEGACDFTPEFLYYLVEEVGFSKEQAEQICDAIEESVAEDLKEIFEKKAIKLISTYTIIRIPKSCWKCPSKFQAASAVERISGHHTIIATGRRLQICRH